MCNTLTARWGLLLSCNCIAAGTHLDGCGQDYWGQDYMYLAMPLKPKPDMSTTPP